MINQLLQEIEELLNFTGAALVVGAFAYIIVLSVLQVRQIRILQEKVKTDFDDKVRILMYAYLVFQLIIFVIAVLFL